MGDGHWDDIADPCEVVVTLEVLCREAWADGMGELAERLERAERHVERRDWLSAGTVLMPAVSPVLSHWGADSGQFKAMLEARQAVREHELEERLTGHRWN